MASAFQCASSQMKSESTPVIRRAEAPVGLSERALMLLGFSTWRRIAEHHRREVTIAALTGSGQL